MEILRFEQTSVTSPIAVRLMTELDIELAWRNPGVPIGGLDAAQFDGLGGVFVVARRDEELAACGALLPLGDGIVEIKRIYVVPALRGRGVARRLLDHLLREARARGWNTARLGTGKGHREALTLYRTLGFSEIPRFGAYRDDTNAVCMEKAL